MRSSHPVDVLQEEHEVILAVLGAMDRRAREIEEGQPVESRFWLRAAEFMENYGDRCHHAKEEDLLFPALLDCGMPDRGGPVGVMKHEHVEGRALEERLRLGATNNEREELLRAAHGLSYLLHEHIHKENEVLFPMARRMLGADQVQDLLDGFSSLEERVMGDGSHGRYVEIARELCVEAGVPFPGAPR